MASYTAQSRESGRAPLDMDTSRETDRTWWVQPVLTVIVLTAFGIYTTFRAFENNFYFAPWAQGYGPHTATYLSPFYSPFIPLKLHIGTFAISPAMYILIFPLSFRLTCYYYRKAYYRAFFWDPPACAITEPREGNRMKYTGEREFPFILQNLHRFAFYAAVVILLVLWYDAFRAFFFRDTPGGPAHFGMGLGTIIFLVNVVLLSCYTFGCHSWRHLIGGKVNCYSCSAASMTRHGLWKQVSFLNKRHAMYAWLSLFSVAITDIYVRFVASGAITDLRIF